MRGIYFKDGLYVLIDNKEISKDCILHYEGKKKVHLYGGRVFLDFSNIISEASLTVDGTSVIRLTKGDFYINVTGKLPIPTIISHLNAIEARGVDAFIENYKQILERWYIELKNLNLQTESQLSSENNDSRKERLLNDLFRLKNILVSVLVVLFNLSTLMGNAIENEKINTIYQSLIYTLAEIK